VLPGNIGPEYSGTTAIRIGRAAKKVKIVRRAECERRKRPPQPTGACAPSGLSGRTSELLPTDHSRQITR
jgi:hypothetical protein